MIVKKYFRRDAIENIIIYDINVSDIFFMMKKQEIKSLKNFTYSKLYDI